MPAPLPSVLRPRLERVSAHRLAPAAALAAALALGAAAAPAAAPPPPLPQVTVAAVVARDVEESDQFTGRLEAVDAVEVRPRVSGLIERVSFGEGREVRAGDLLFAIDQRPYRAELERAEAELERVRSRAVLAKSEVARARALVERQAISREEFDARVSAERESAAAIRGAAAAVETARLNLGWTRVRAPISGRIGRAEVTEGNLVQAGPPTPTRLATIVSVDSMYLYFDSDERTYLKYGARAAAGGAGGTRGARPAARPVYMALATDTGFAHTGYVDFVDNQMDAATGTIRTRAVFANRDRTFAPGLFARVKLVSGARARRTLVRDAAVGTDQDRKFVLVLKADGTVDYRAVQLGPVDGGLRVITAGLADGERVVVTGLQRVRPGMKVTAKVEPMLPPGAAPGAAPAVAAAR